MTQAASPSDRELILRTQGGDTGAFGALVSRYMERLYYAALGLGGSHDDALDLSQDAFVRAYRARATIDAERPWYPWVYQILRRLCYNFVRDQRTRSERLREAGPWLELTQPEPDAAWRVEREELQQHVSTALSTLPMEHREVLVLKEYDGLRYREIAELLDIPIGTVMSRLYAARRRMAERLEFLR